MCTICTISCLLVIPHILSCFHTFPKTLEGIDDVLRCVGYNCRRKASPHASHFLMQLYPNTYTQKHVITYTIFLQLVLRGSSRPGSPTTAVSCVPPTVRTEVKEMLSAHAPHRIFETQRIRKIHAQVSCNCRRVPKDMFLGPLLHCIAAYQWRIQRGALGAPAPPCAAKQ